jgi:ribosomal protein S18 acetylase RimI-like enzyme
MNYTIRELSINERDVLETFLYHAIYIPEGINPPPFEIIKQPELQVYIKGFGEQEGDICFVAECDSKIVGAVWVRIMNDYWHISNDMPSLAISLLPEYRDKGIGTALMKSMQEMVSQQGYKGISLSVQKQNYAAKMYRKLGFNTIEDKDEELIMVYTAK